MGFFYYSKIIRPLNCFMAALAVWIGYCIALGFLKIDLFVLTAMASAFLICGAGQAINDFFDLEVDKKLHPQKPLPAKKIKPLHAFYYSLLLFAVGIILAYTLTVVAFGIAVLFSALLFFYSWKMGRQKFLGNYVVAAGTAFTLVYGASLVGCYTEVTILALSAFFANIAREIVKDAEDMKADKGFKKTLPMILKKKQLQSFVLLVLGLAMLFSYFVLLTGFGNLYYLVLISAANLLFAKAFHDFLKQKFKESQGFFKKGMIIALIAFIAGVL